MTTPTSARSQRRTIGFTVLMLFLAVVMLVIAWSALAQEVLTWPENQRIAAELDARLKVLREERDSLYEEIADLKIQAEKHKAVAEQVGKLTQELEILQSELMRARAERDRLSKESTSLASDVAVKKDLVKSLTEQERELRNELELLENRTQVARKGFQDAQQELFEKQEEQIVIGDQLTAERKTRDLVKSELSELEQTLAKKSNDLNELVVEERSISNRINKLKIRFDELSASNTSEQNYLVKVRADIDSTRVELENLRKERDSTKNELDRAKATLDITNTQKEAVAARLENLIRHEAQIRQQLRSMIDQLKEAELIVNSTAATES